MDAVRAAIRDVPDFPKKGIVFKDLTPVLADPALFGKVIDAFVARWKDQRIARVVSVESRGFLFGAPLAYAIGAGLGIVRKPGKLPYQTVREAYDLEYGQDALELHIDAVTAGERVLVVDDLLATGGTAAAAARLVERQGGVVAGLAFVVELGVLNGRDRLGERDVQALVTFLGSTRTGDACVAPTRGP
jgi:adenine phosphoribosyltransferase